MVVDCGVSPVQRSTVNYPHSFSIVSDKSCCSLKKKIIYKCTEGQTLIRNSIIIFLKKTFNKPGKIWKYSPVQTVLSSALIILCVGSRIRKAFKTTTYLFPPFVLFLSEAYLTSTIINYFTN